MAKNEVSYILVNEKKVARAKEALRKQGKPITDKSVLELYKLYGGLVLEEKVAEAALKKEDLLQAQIIKTNEEKV